MIFLLDASTLITANAQYYQIDRVPEFWDWLLHQAENGLVKMPLEIYEEVQEGPDDQEKDQLFGWISEDTVRKALVLPEDADPGLVDHVTRNGYAEDLTDTEIDQIGRDPFLIASALLDPSNRVVVTAEVSQPKKIRQNRKIPDVCTSFGIRSVDIFGLVRELDFRTSWKSK